VLCYLTIIAMTKLILFFSFILFSASCDRQNIQINDTSSNGNILATFNKEIKTYKDGRSKGDTDYLFKAVKQDASWLDLDLIENGFDSLQIRIWLGHSMAVKRNVVVLKKVNGQWLGQVITYSIRHDDSVNKQVLERKEVKQVNPKSGWTHFIEQLTELQILALPNGQDIKGYNSCGGMDGIDYFFEAASPKQYRFYYYCNPDENVNQFWQVKNVVNFSTLFEKEFDFTYTR
jgi:hypothetical protein